MADSRITQLTALTASGLASLDVLPVADVSASQTKKIAAVDLITAGVGLISSGTIDIAKLNQSSATKLGTSALADASVTAAKLGSGSTVSVGTTAPVSDNYVGRGFFNTSTSVFQVYNGSSYVAASASVGSGAITDAQLASNAVTTAKVLDDAITYAKIQNVSTNDVLLGRSSAGSGNIEEIALTAAGRALIDDASAAAQRVTLGLGNLATASGSWVDGSSFSGTSSGTNTGDQTITLTGDVTGSGTGSFATVISNDAITSTKIANEAVTSSKIATNAVTGTQLADGVITEVKISDNAVTATKIAAGAIGSTQLASAGVTYAKIQNTSTTDVVLGRSSAGGGTIQEIPLTSAGRALIDDATAADQRNTLGLGTLATANGTWVNGSSFSGNSTGTNTGDQTITLTGDVTGTGTGSFATTIASASITESKIATNAISTIKVQDNAITADKLGDNSTVVVSAAVPTGSGTFVGQHWLNSSTGVEYIWNGSSWQRQAAINTITVSGSVPFTFTTTYPDNFSATITPSANVQAATYVWAGPASGTDAAPTFRALLPGDLPAATSTTRGAVQPGTGLQMASGIINHINATTSGVYTKVTVDAQGHVSAGTTLSASDIPSLDASKITTGTLGTAYIADDAITATKLANYSVAKIGDALPNADHIGQFFFSPLDKNIYLWDGNVWQPVGVSLGEIVFAGTYNASLNKVASTTSAGSAAGLVAGSGLPAASATFNSYYLVVSSGGTGIAPAPTTVLNPPDILLCNGSAWNEVDVSSTYTGQTASNIAFVASGTIGSTNVQAAILEAASEAANASNITSGTLSALYGGTGYSSFTKGDLLVASGTTGLSKLTAGTNGFVLRANSATTTGLEWSADYVGTVTNVTSSTAALTVTSGTTTPALAIRSATTSLDGIVSLTDSISTTSSTIAATATAVKTAYDLANNALPKAGGTVTGNVTLSTNVSLLFEGSINDAFKTTLFVVNPTANRTVYLPDLDGTVALVSQLNDGTY